MDFSISPEIDSIRQRINSFVTEQLLPVEADRANYDEHDNIRDEVLATLRAKARAAGLWAPQMPPARGGMGLPVVGMAACYEAMNYSIFGPVTFNCAAPDDGNMILLNKVGTEAQKDALAAADHRRQGALRVRHDRTASGRRLRSEHDADHGRAPRRPLGDPRPQMVHHRRRRRTAFHSYRQNLGRSAQGPHCVPVRCQPARLAHRAPDSDHGPGGAWRPLRAGVRRPGNS